MIHNCKFCSLSHERGNCKAFGAKCHKCQGLNHFARCCPKNRDPPSGRSVREVQETDGENYNHVNEITSEFHSLYIEAITGAERKQLQMDLELNDSTVTFKLDTGAECNIIPEHLAQNIKNSVVESTSMTLKSFGGKALHTLGKCFLKTRVKNSDADSIPMEYYVVKGAEKPLLGLEACLRAWPNTHKRSGENVRCHH